MRPLDELLPPLRAWKRPLLTAALASVSYTFAVFWYSVRPSSSVSVSGTLWHSLALHSLFAFGTVGVPLLLWTRYEIRAPSILMALILLFWHVLVYLPPFGSGEGDAPGFTFVFLFAPAYLVAYGLLASVECRLRGRNVSVSTGTV